MTSTWAPGLTAATVTRWLAARRTCSGRRAAGPGRGRSRHDPDPYHLGRRRGPGVRRNRPGRRGPPLPGRDRLRHRPRHHPAPCQLRRAQRWCARSRARPRPDLGHPGGRARRPDPDLARQGRQLDRDCHERWRVTPGGGARQCRRRYALTTLDRRRPAGRRGPGPGRRDRPQCRRPPRSQGTTSKFPPDQEQ